MIFRKSNGELIIINRFNYVTDEEYYQTIMNLFN